MSSTNGPRPNRLRGQLPLLEAVGQPDGPHPRHDGKQAPSATADHNAPRIHSVSQLVRLASRQLEQRFEDVWVEGEVSNLSQPGSGHLYFTLKDRRSQLSVVIFRSAAQRLGFRVDSGQVLRCRGRLGIYDVQGRFQLTAEYAEPSGLGALQLAFEQLKRKLSAEGLFDPAHKKPLPSLPQQIVVVTSSSGAAFRDILRVLHRRCPVRVVLCPTPVQGAEAPIEICAALRRADALGADLIIVGRGGGSLEDLWAFNNEHVARTLFRLQTPVISAVGHEIDTTIADLVADHRAATPSAAAERAVPVMAELVAQLTELGTRLARGALQSLRRDRLRLDQLGARLGSPRTLLDRSRMQIDDLTVRIHRIIVQDLHGGRERLSRLRLRLSAQHPRTRLARDRAALSGLDERLRSSIAVQLECRRALLVRYAATLQALSPLGVLARGYSLARDEQGRVVLDAQNVRVGSHLQLQLHRGQLRARVEEVTQEITPTAQKKV